MDLEYIAAIIQKHLQGDTLSEAEQLALDHWNSDLKLYLEQRMDETGVEQAFDTFRQRVEKKPAPVYILSRRRWIAAAVVILLAGSAYLLFSRGNGPRQEQADTDRHIAMDVQPGKQGAILTLANGRRVVLDSMGNGLVATQNGAAVILENGRLTYNRAQAKTDEITFNTMTTPKGRKFQLVLPDGTKVWLNAASTLTFPTAFTAGERNVSVTGEAYFEVAKNAAIPFKVTINDQEKIEVLGTSFNVHAYADERSMHTTLLEGSVRVISENEKVLLRPGELAAVSHSNPGSSGINIQKANIEKVMAWKNDLFDFENATLAEVMNEISRWYDIDVVYEKGVPAFEFGGKIRRDLTLANLLKFLEGAGVHFRIEAGRKLIVMP